GGYGVANGRRLRWWQFGTYPASLQDALKSVSHCLALSQVSAQHSIAVLPSDRLFAHTVVAFPTDKLSAFSVLQSRPHEIWARFFGSSLEDRLRYTPSDCFETFPFPEGWETSAELEAIGKEYYEYRAQLMIDSNKGLTKTYNRFHDPKEKSPEIRRLRE